MILLSALCLGLAASLASPPAVAQDAWDALMRAGDVDVPSGLVVTLKHPGLNTLDKPPKRPLGNLIWSVIATAPGHDGPDALPMADHYALDAVTAPRAFDDPALAQVNADNTAVRLAFRDLIGPAIAAAAKGDWAEAAAHGRPLAMMVTVVFTVRTEQSGNVNMVRDEKTLTFHDLQGGSCAAMDPAVLVALAGR